MPVLESKTVNFGKYNSKRDLGVIFKSLVIGTAEPQTVLIDVPFRDGVLDQTDYFGDVRYKSRTLTMDFIIPWWAENQNEIYSNVMRKLHGKRTKIVFSSDTHWYYEGRLTVGDWSIDNGMVVFQITAIVDPYKYHDTVLDNIEVKKQGTFIDLYNDMKPAVISVTADKPIVLTYGLSSDYEPEIDYDLVKKVGYVEYIESTGAQFINTGVIPDIDTRVVFDDVIVKPITSNDVVFGSYDSNTTAAYALRLRSNSINNVVASIGLTQNLMAGAQSHFKHHIGIIVSKNRLYFGDDYAFSEPQFPSEYNLGPLILFSMNGPLSADAYSSDISVFGPVKIYQGDTLVRDFVPALMSDAHACLYDRLNDVVYPNNSTSGKDFKVGYDYSGSSVSIRIPAGTTKIPDFVMKSGKYRIMTVGDDATISISYKEGRL